MFDHHQVSLIKENESRYYLNTTIHLLYYNVLFRQLILNIDFYHDDWSGKKFNILSIITKRPWLWRSYRKNWWDIFRGKKIISTNDLFILANLRINCHTDAGEFEGLLFNIFSEEPFKNHILIWHMKRMIIPYLIMFLRILASQ